MNTIDHLSLGVPSIEAGREFYDELMGILGLTLLAATEEFAAYGVHRPEFLLMTPSNGEAYSTGNGTHIALSAPTKESVHHFHHHATRHGGHCEGTPGPRPAYPKPGVYVAFVRDPFGNKLEAIHNGFSA